MTTNENEMEGQWVCPCFKLKSSSVWAVQKIVPNVRKCYNRKLFCSESGRWMVSHQCWNVFIISSQKLFFENVFRHSWQADGFFAVWILSLKFDENVFSPENKSPEKQQWLLWIVFHFPEKQYFRRIFQFSTPKSREVSFCWLERSRRYPIWSNFPLCNRMNYSETQISKEAIHIKLFRLFIPVCKV